MTSEEVEKVIRKLREEKATGMNVVPNEAWNLWGRGGEDESMGD